MESYLHISIRIPLEGTSILDHANTLSGIKEPLAELREALPGNHEYIEKIEKVRDPAAPRRGRKPKLAA